jgi:hypothetical protein
MIYQRWFGVATKLGESREGMMVRCYRGGLLLNCLTSCVLHRNPKNDVVVLRSYCLRHDVCHDKELDLIVLSSSSNKVVVNYHLSCT